MAYAGTVPEKKVHITTSVLGITCCIQEQRVGSKGFEIQKIQQKYWLNIPSSLLSSHIKLLSLQKLLQVQPVKMDLRTDLLFKKK